ncbi:MAG: CPCC family cysteine-rich protein [Gemmatimonadaceae bacterium]
MLSSLPSWQLWVLAAVVVIAAVELIARVAARIRARASTTIYRFDASSPDSLGHGGAGHDHHHEDADPPPHFVMGDAARPPAIADHNDQPRIICPCCGYPTARDFSPTGTCVLCDWQDPDLAAESPDHARAEYAAALNTAKDNLAQFGSAASPTPARTPHSTEQRDELRRLYDYLMSEDRPDAADAWRRIDALVLALHAG